MNASAYVTDGELFKENHIELIGVEKERVWDGKIYVWCRAASESATRFQVTDPLDAAGSLVIYSIPLHLIADYHLDPAEKLLLPSPAAIFNTDTDKLSDNLQQELKRMMRGERLSKRSYNLITEVAEKQKIIEVKEFFHKNTERALRKITGFGSGTIEKLQELAEKHDLELREN